MERLVLAGSTRVALERIRVGLCDSGALDGGAATAEWSSDGEEMFGGRIHLADGTPAPSDDGYGMSVFGAVADLHDSGASRFRATFTTDAVVVERYSDRALVELLVDTLTGAGKRWAVAYPAATKYSQTPVAGSEPFPWGDAGDALDVLWDRAHANGEAPRVVVVDATGPTPELVADRPFQGATVDPALAELALEAEERWAQLSSFNSA